jgi:hypothetical protein
VDARVNPRRFKRLAPRMTTQSGNSATLVTPTVRFAAPNYLSTDNDDEQRMESRFGHEVREFAQIRRSQKP